MHQIGNSIEAFLWFGLALVIAIRSFYYKKTTKSGVIAFFALILFAFSDLVEAKTGAWWRPWWLLLWKVSCLCAMALSFFLYTRRTNSRAD